MHQKDNYCSYCRSIGKIETNYHAGRRVCTQCGVVTEERFLDPTAEYNKYAEESKRTAYDPTRAD